jgi:FMN phosphatase YigB (HAD superfamily)
MKRLTAGEPVDLSAYYVRVIPAFKAGPGPYEWLNRIVAVAVGDRRPTGPNLRGSRNSLRWTPLGRAGEPLRAATVLAEDIQTILAFGRTMTEHPVELIEGAREVLETLRSRDHELWLITKGDLFDQESKIARSGLVGLFHHIEIVAERDQVTYQRLLDRYGVSPDEFLMVGNSLRSDVLPVVEMGGRAVHVPYEITWEHEQVEGDIPVGALSLASLTELLEAETAREPGD